MKLDPGRSRIAVYTFAEGLFSALAHDLEIVAGDATGDADGDRVELRFPVASLRVSGVMKRGALRTDVLSAADRAAIEKQIREDVLPGAGIVARGTRDGSRASIELVGPRRTTRVSCALSATTEAGATRAKGSVEVSLKALGCPPVKAPMGAFRVKDAVRVEFDLVLV